MSTRDLVALGVGCFLLGAFLYCGYYTTRFEPEVERGYTLVGVGILVSVGLNTWLEFSTDRPSWYLALTFIGYAIGLWSTLMMEWVPEGKLARVTSLDFFGAIGLVPLGYALTAVVSSAVEPATILTFGFLLAGILWATPLLVCSVREAA